MLSFKKNKKKKNKNSQIYLALNIAKEEAYMNGRKVFYHPLSQQEVPQAQSWAFDNNITIELSHQDGNTLIYKFIQQGENYDKI